MDRTILFLLMAMAGFIIFACLFNTPPRPSAELEPFPEAVGKAIDIELETTKQLTAWSAALIGGLAALVLSKETNLRVDSPGQKLLFMTCALTGFCAIFAGHYVQSRMAEMLSNLFYNRTDPMIARPRTIQYYSFLASIACFSALILSVLGSGSRKEP